MLGGVPATAAIARTDRFFDAVGSATYIAVTATLLALAPALGAVQLPSPADAATAVQTTGTIEVHARMCDEVPVSGDWFGACHDDPSLVLAVHVSRMPVTLSW